MERKSPDDAYSEQETEARMQAALRGARLVGPKPKSSMTPKQPKKQTKRAVRTKQGEEA